MAAVPQHRLAEVWVDLRHLANDLRRAGRLVAEVGDLADGERGRRGGRGERVRELSHPSVGGHGDLTGEHHKEKNSSCEERLL